METNQIILPIRNQDGTPFHNIELRKPVVESVVMSLGDKITGEFYYNGNRLHFTMNEYVLYDGVKYKLVDPPTILREGMVSENSSLNGATKYSVVFYHPMYMLGNFEFSDIAVTLDERRYLSQNKTFAWIGNLYEFIAKLNANLSLTEWVVSANIPSTDETLKQKAEKISDVLSFDKVFVSDALKTAYDTWEIPFVITSINEEDARYSQGKRFLIEFGLPTQEIYGDDGVTPFVFQFGQGVGLKNDSRTPKNNKIVTRISGYGSEGNIPYGYPQIPWYGDPSWDYTINNDNTNPNSYPIYDGILGGRNVRLIKHPFTRKNLMPSIYSQTLFNKVSPYNPHPQIPAYNNTLANLMDMIDIKIVQAESQDVKEAYETLKSVLNSVNNTVGATSQFFSDSETQGDVYMGFVAKDSSELIGGYLSGVTGDFEFEEILDLNKFLTSNPNYNPNTEIIDYYDATAPEYPNPITPNAPSYEIHEFDKIKPRLGDASLVGVSAYYAPSEVPQYLTVNQVIRNISDMLATEMNVPNERAAVIALREALIAGEMDYVDSKQGGSYNYEASITHDDFFLYITFKSSIHSFDYVALYASSYPVVWDDSMDDEGNYKQSYFKVTLPQLSFDIYACASITEEMQINMRSGACMGCTFNIQVDWDDYKKNFFLSDGTFDPVVHTTEGDGHVRDGQKYPDSSQGQITVIVAKDIDTFGTIMPNIYQQPQAGDKFVILGISLPTSYISTAEQELDDAMKEYMLENNIYHFEYPLKFDEYFLTTHPDILSQMHNNSVVRFLYADEPEMSLFIKQMSIKYGDKPLPQYDITLSDDVEIVLNKIGQVTDDVSRVRVQLSELQKYYQQDFEELINSKLDKLVDDVCQGRITFQQGLDALGSVVLSGDLKSNIFQQGMFDGKGWKVDQLGNAEFESIRARSFLEVVELLVNRLQAQEGDTIFSDNDQIERVDKDTDETTGNISYVLSLKEKWQGYVTSQQEGNILCGIINTLAAKVAGVSNEENNNPKKQGSDDGGNKYYTSWMYVVATHNEENSLGLNQIRVVLYGDNEVPSDKNFEPCEFMAIARRGCIDYADPQSEDYQRVLASIKRRQQLFYLSTSEGRIVKLTGVNKPKLEAGNYGTTLGIVPDFVKQWAIADRLIDGRDYLYAQGVIVGDFIKVDAQGSPIVTFVDKGEWQNNTEYLYSEYNEVTLQYETHEVWHNGSLWRVKQHQPVVSGGVSTYYEPTDNNSAYWQKLMSSGDSTRQIYSYSSNAPVVPQQYAQDDEYLPTGWSNTPLALSQQHKDVYISTRKKRNGTWNNWSTPVLFSHLAEDGTSISIKGYALYLFSEDVQGNPRPQTSQLTDANLGDIDLLDYDDYQGDMIDVVEDNGDDTYIWAGYSVPLGSCYIWMGNNHLYQATENGWMDLGQIKGDKGDDGKNTATVFIYKRSASQPTNTDKPTSTVAYSFAYGSLSGNLNGWSAIIPQSDGNPCWVRQVFVSSDSPTVTIAPTSWSTANKYTEDGKDGVSIEAQYSPDAIQIHTTWQTGDLYMRTRATNEASWSNWQRIVGEDGANGDYTDYSFGISALLETASPTTPPSDISTWADAPIGTTEQKPYLWSRVIKYVWVNGVKTVESTTYIRLTGEQGQQGIQGIQGEKGDQGDRGKVGRFFYFGGTFNPQDNDPTHVFAVNDAQAPYFEHTENGQKRYHVFNYDTNGSYTMAQMWAISNDWNNEPWEAMTNDFKYLITEALFGDYAHLGSAIINGDWILSSNGTIVGQEYTKDDFVQGKIIAESGSPQDFKISPYTLFNSENPVIDKAVFYSGSKTIDANVESVRIRDASFYLEQGNVYVLDYQGYSNANSAVYISIVGAGQGVSGVNARIIYLPSTSQSGRFMLQVAVTGYYYFNLTQDASSRGGVLTSCTISRAFFKTAYAVDLKTGVSYQTQVYASGGMRSPFTFTLPANPQQPQETDIGNFNDNYALYSTSAEENAFTLPWDLSQSGRKICLTNYKWNNQEQPTTGYCYINTPSGKYFYEDGIRKNVLKLSREGVELLGFGDLNNFYGWIVIKRFDLVTESRYGRGLKALAYGRIIVNSDHSVSVSSRTFDGTEITCVRNSIGNYTVSFSQRWCASDITILPILTAFGYSKNANGSQTTNPAIVSHISSTRSSFTVAACDKDSNQVDCSFSFLLTNFNDWMYIEDSVDN